MIEVEVTIPHLYAKVDCDHLPDDDEVSSLCQEMAGLFGVRALDINVRRVGWVEDINLETLKPYRTVYQIILSVPAGSKELRSYVRANKRTTLFIEMM